MARNAKRDAEPNVYVEDSGIHGRGLFAARDLEADTLILTIEGRPTQEDGVHVIWVHVGEAMEGFEITNEARYVNHSRSPNAAFFDEELWSLRRIRKGEEITHHYGPDWDDL